MRDYLRIEFLTKSGFTILSLRLRSIKKSAVPMDGSGDTKKNWLPYRERFRLGKLTLNF